MTKPAQVTRVGEGTGRIRMAVVAPQSFGKTVFCGTAPKALFLTTDPEGTISARRLGSRAEEWRISKWDDLDEAYRWLRDEGLASEGYEFVIVDNITEAHRMALQKSMEISKANSNQPSRLDAVVPQKQDYQRQQLTTLRFVLQMNDLPVHIIYTSHIAGLEDENGEPFYSAAIRGQQGALCNQIIGYCNIVGMGEVIPDVDPNKEPVRRLWFTGHGPYRGKDRFHALHPYQDGLTVPKMMELIGNPKPINKPAAAAPKAVRAAGGPATRRVPPRRPATTK